MNRPYIVCHMVTSLDGKVTGDFLAQSACEAATTLYYELNRTLPSQGFICGRVTMEGSFTGGHAPDLSACEAVCDGADHVIGVGEARYAVAFDTHGKLGWTSNRIVDPDGDPGYDGARILEVLSRAADARYLSYLREREIPYILAGDTTVDVNEALGKLKTLFGLERLLLEGGSVLNGAFARAAAVDELSLVVAPLVAEAADKPLFWDSVGSEFTLMSCKVKNGVVLERFCRPDGNAASPSRGTVYEGIADGVKTLVIAPNEAQARALAWKKFTQQLGVTCREDELIVRRLFAENREGGDTV